MDFSWTPQQSDLYERAVDFASTKLQPLIARRGLHAWFTREEWTLCGESGLLGLSAPETYGGRGLGALTTARTVEGFARGCSDTGLLFSASAHLFACVMPIADHASDELKARVLPKLTSGEWIGANAITEAEAGSDVFALAARATRDGDGWVLDGRKTFITNGPVADLYLVYASTNPSHRYLGISAFVVERGAPGLTVEEPFDKIGLESTPSGAVRLESCPVGDGSMVGAEGSGAAIFRSSMAWERACLFAQYLGAMDRQLEAVVDFAKRRKQFGKPIARYQAVSHRIADMKLRLESARLLLYRACWQKEQGIDATVDIALAKIAVSEGAVASGVDAVRLFGGAGVNVDGGIERMLRDAVPGLIFSGTSEIQRELVARGLGL